MNRNKNIQYFFAAIMVIAAITGCYYDKEELLYPGSTAAVDCSTVQAKFGADVLPVISAKCATSGCHNGSASGGLVLQDYGQISGAKDRLNARALIEKTMPPSGPLQPSEINTIKCWLESGAPNN